MKNLKNILTIASLGLITSLNLNAQDTTKFYDDCGRLKKEIIKLEDLKIKNIYKYDGNGQIIEEFTKRHLPNAKYHEKKKYDERGITEFFWELDDNNDGKFDKRGKVNYKQNGVRFQYDNDGDGIYEREYEQQYGCPCICPNEV